MYNLSGELASNYKDPENPTFLTGHAEFDQCINGLSPGELILVAGKLGSINEMFIDSLAVHLAFSRDVYDIKHDRDKEIIRLNLFSVLGVESYSELSGRRLSFWGASDYYFVQHIERAIKSFTNRFSNPVIFISRLQDLSLLEDNTEISRNEEIRSILFNLKRIAVKYKTPIIIDHAIHSEVEFNSTPACMQDLYPLGKAVDCIDKIIFTHWEDFFINYDSGLPAGHIAKIQVTISGGSKTKFSQFNFPMGPSFHKIWFKPL